MSVPLLLERDRALDELSSRLDDAVRGHGRLVLLSGEAGVGKTSVLRRFSATASTRAAVSWGWGDPLSTPRPLGPWLDIASDLGVTFPERSDALSAALRLVLDALSTGGARVLVFEDVHWADGASLDLLRLLVRRFERRPVLLVASYRDDELGAEHPLRVWLGNLSGMSAVGRVAIHPLSPAAVAQLADCHLGVDADELYGVTGGNPFFVTEVLTSGSGIPSSVAAAVGGRLARVSAGAQQLAGLVAVLGSPARMSIIAALVAESDALVAELVAAGVLRPIRGGVGFRHELARMAVLDAMSDFAQASWHARVLQQLVTGPEHDHALLAHHADAAGDAAAVLRFAPLAGAEAAASGAHREAAAQYRRALRFADDLPSETLAELLQRFAQAGLLSGQLPDAIEALEEVVRLQVRVGDRLREGDASRSLAIMLWQTSRCADAWRANDRALRALESRSPSTQLGWAYLNTCQLSAYNQHGTVVVERYAQQAIDLAERFADDEVIGQARFHQALSGYISADRPEQDCWAVMESARTDMTESGFLDGAGFMAMLMATYAVTHREFERAAAARHALEALADERDLLSYTVVARSSEPLQLLYAGRWETATDVARPLLKQAGSGAVARIMPSVALGLIRARRGDPGAQEPIDEVVDTFEPVGWVLLAYAARAEVAWLSGEHDKARAVAERGLAATSEHSDPWIVGELARWLAMTADEPPPLRVAEPFAWEMVGEWERAAQAWEQRGSIYDAAFARLRGDAAAVLCAREAFEALGARAAAAVAGARLRELGVPPGSRGPRPSTRENPFRLTSRQAEILRLVAEGLTDGQIAGRLHVSSKTVNHHVTAALAKLGVHSRGAAIAKLSDG